MWASICLFALVLAGMSSGNAHPGIAGCLCSSGTIPVSVNVKLPVDPATEPLNTTSLRELRATYNIFGIFCQPSPAELHPPQDHVQLLLHGSTYTSQYWTWPINGFQNYSYVSHACTQGHSTFAYDQVGVGLSDRPANSTDIQLPTSASISASLAHQLKSGEIAAAFGLTPKRFKKLVAIGHSQGSVVFNYAAIIFGIATPFDAMILSGHIHDPTFLASAKLPRPAARDVNPARWANLDPGYISISNRSQFFSPDNSTFSADLVQVDELTKDVSTLWYTAQTGAIYVPATGYKGPVVELIGENDQLHCLNGGDGFIPCNATVLQVSEAPFYPDSQNFTMIVREGQGHDLNLDFGAGEMFKVFSNLVRDLTK